MIRDTVMNRNDYDPLTDLLIGEAVLSLLKSKGRIIDEISNMVARRGKNNTVGTSGAEHNWDEPNSLLGSPQQPGTNKIH